MMNSNWSIKIMIVNDGQRWCNDGERQSMMVNDGSDGAIMVNDGAGDAHDSQ